MANEITVTLKIQTEGDIHTVAQELSEWFDPDEAWETDSGIPYSIESVQIGMELD